jgi:hypothetical protein
VSDQVAAIRSAGYEGPLTMGATALASGDVLVLHLIAFKNLRAREEEQQRLGGYRYVLPPVVSRLVGFFAQHLRPLLAPKAANPFLFVQTKGRDKGGWMNAKRDAFGALCGSEHGLGLGTSIRSVRHIVSTEAVRSEAHALGAARVCLSCCCRQQCSARERADIAAANLHSLAVVDRHYVDPAAWSDVSAQPAAAAAEGDFLRGLGRSAPFLSPLSLRSRCASVRVLSRRFSTGLWRATRRLPPPPSWRRPNRLRDAGSDLPYGTATDAMSAMSVTINNNNSGTSHRGRWRENGEGLANQAKRHGLALKRPMVG